MRPEIRWSPPPTLRCPKTRGLGLGAVAKEARANGWLAARNTEPVLAERRQVLLELAPIFDATPDAVVPAAALAGPLASAVLSGAATSGQLASNLKSL